MGIINNDNDNEGIRLEKMEKKKETLLVSFTVELRVLAVFLLFLCTLSYIYGMAFTVGRLIGASMPEMANSTFQVTTSGTSQSADVLSHLDSSIYT